MSKSQNCAFAGRHQLGDRLIEVYYADLRTVLNHNASLGIPRGHPSAFKAGWYWNEISGGALTGFIVDTGPFNASRGAFNDARIKLLNQPEEAKPCLQPTS